MKLTEEQLLKNYKTFEAIVEKYLSEERKEKVKVMLKDLEETMVLAPAAASAKHHGAYPGGYLVHVIQVVKNALKLTKFYEEMGGTVDYTEEELVFAALFHDLGKLGNGEKPYYLPQDNEWRQKNLQENYAISRDIEFMAIAERSLYILQKYGIQVNQKEWMGIRLHDGVFEEINKPYFIADRPGTNLVYVLHVADYLAAKIEMDRETKA